MARRPVLCTVAWSDPRSRAELLNASLPKAHYVYAITVGEPGHQAIVRIGATADLKGRLRGYPVLDFIPQAAISYSDSQTRFGRDLEPMLVSYFSDQANTRPDHLVAKDLAYCIKRELNSIEYKVERLLLEEYRRRHRCLPPGNPRTGSERAYLHDVAIVEEGVCRVLDMPCARLAPVELGEEQLLRLLW
jgi:hypothetical protein